VVNLSSQSIRLRSVLLSAALRFPTFVFNGYHMANIDIPNACRRVKPVFELRPNAELISEIQSFIATTGLPHMWRGHTHTKPPAEAKIVYVGEFDLPLSHQSKGKWAPCPCCSPEHTKYCKRGKIAWFPKECTIRMLGPDCFAAIDERGHEEALREFSRRAKAATA
jgi:hypothetical protein